MTTTDVNMETGLDVLLREVNARKEEKLWQGTFRDYYDRVKRNPSCVETAAQRLYAAIMRHGYTEVDTASDKRLYRIYGRRTRKIIRYHFFEPEFYGIDLTIMRVMEFLKAAASGGEESRQIMYFIGPVGTGKSSIVEEMKRALEMSGPFHALDGCPLHEEPFHLVPEEFRGAFERNLGLAPGAIRGHLCPLCKLRLEEEYRGDLSRFEVVERAYSEENGVGIGALPPADENSADVSLLIGKVNLGLVQKYHEAHPRVIEWSGALNRGNRGLVDLVEMNKNPTDLLHPLITTTQEHRYRAPGDFPMISSDTVLVAHSNETEYQNFIAKGTNEALRDRIVSIKFRYTTQFTAQKQIVGKIVERKSRFMSTEDPPKPTHFAPGTKELCAMFTQLTVLKPSNKVELLTKLKLYDGQEVPEISAEERPIDVQELFAEAGPDEGFEGLSTRWATKALGAAIARSSQSVCVAPVAVMEVLDEFIRDMDVDAEEREFLSEKILKGTCRKWYLQEILREHIMMAYVHAYEDQAQQMWQRYLDHVLAYNQRQQVRDPVTSEIMDPDEHLMEEIERPIGVTSKSRADQFRSSIASFVASRAERKEEIRFDAHEQVCEAVKRVLFRSVKHFARVISKTAVKTEEDEERYDAMIESMREKFGYCPHCSEVVLAFAANQNLFQD